MNTNRLPTHAGAKNVSLTSGLGSRTTGSRASLRCLRGRSASPKGADGAERSGWQEEGKREKYLSYPVPCTVPLIELYIAYNHLCNARAMLLAGDKCIP